MIDQCWCLSYVYTLMALYSFFPNHSCLSRVTPLPQPLVQLSPNIVVLLSTEQSESWIQICTKNTISSIGDVFFTISLDMMPEAPLSNV